MTATRSTNGTDKLVRLGLDLRPGRQVNFRFQNTSWLSSTGERFQDPAYVKSLRQRATSMHETFTQDDPKRNPLDLGLSVFDRQLFIIDIDNHSGVPLSTFNERFAWSLLPAIKRIMGPSATLAFYSQHRTTGSAHLWFHLNEPPLTSRNQADTLQELLRGEADYKHIEVYCAVTGRPVSVLTDTHLYYDHEGRFITDLDSLVTRWEEVLLNRAPFGLHVAKLTSSAPAGHHNKTVSDVRYMSFEQLVSVPWLRYGANTRHEGWLRLCQVCHKERIDEQRAVQLMLLLDDGSNDIKEHGREWAERQFRKMYHGGDPSRAKEKVAVDFEDRSLVRCPESFKYDSTVLERLSDQDKRVLTALLEDALRHEYSDQDWQQIALRDATELYAFMRSKTTALSDVTWDDRHEFLAGSVALNDPRIWSGLELRTQPRKLIAALERAQLITPNHHPVTGQRYHHYGDRFARCWFVKTPERAFRRRLRPAQHLGKRLDWFHDLRTYLFSQPSSVLPSNGEAAVAARSGGSSRSVYSSVDQSVSPSGVTPSISLYLSRRQHRVVTRKCQLKSRPLSRTGPPISLRDRLMELVELREALRFATAGLTRYVYRRLHQGDSPEVLLQHVRVSLSARI